MSKEVGEALMRDDAEIYAAAALTASPVLALHPLIHAAIADFNFNLGTTRYKASTLKRRIDNEDWEGAVEQIMRWVWGGGRKLPGLVARRAAEAELISPEGRDMR